MPRKAAIDAVHVAIAAVNGVDFLLTWNHSVKRQGEARRTCPAALKPMRPPLQRSAMLFVMTMILACDSSSSDDAPTKAPPTIATSSPRASASATPRSTSTPSVAPSPPKTTVASLRKAAAADASAFEGEEVTLDAFFVQVAQKQFGTGEHPRHYFANIDVALEPLAPDAPSAPDTLACYYRERAWPPQGLKPGDPIVVAGRWSLSQLLAGGWRPGSGPLHITACRVKRAPGDRR